MTRLSLRSLTLFAAVPLALTATTARADEPAEQAEAGAPAPLAEEIATPVAEDAPAPAPAPAPAKPGLVLKRGQINVAVNLELNMSADLVGKPVTIAPDVSYGVSDDLTVSLIHSLYGVTGFRAKAGGGLCVTGTDNGCAKVYNNVGAEAWYQLGRGAVPFAVGGGVHALNLDAGFYGAKLGARVRYPMGKLTINTMPSVIVAVTERELNKDTLWIPIQAIYKLKPEVSVGLGTGLKGPLDGFGDAWQVALGAMAMYAVNPKLTVGASWVFGAIVGGAPEPATGLDPRGVQIWGSYTM